MSSFSVNPFPDQPAFGSNTPSGSTVVFVEGPPGTPGLSAYQIAVNNGFVGSETDWLLSLRGGTGPVNISGGLLSSDGTHLYWNGTLIA